MSDQDVRVGLALVPSGAFALSEPITFDPTPTDMTSAGWGPVARPELFSPMPQPEYLDKSEIIERIPVAEASQAIEEHRKRGARSMTLPHIDSYGSQIVDLAIALRAEQPLFIMCPLRGGLKPSLHIQLMSNSVPVESLHYTQGSSGRFDEGIIRDLRRILSKYAELQRDVRFWVVDTSMSGLGASHLAELLRNACGELSGNRWTIYFHLLHGPGVRLRNTLAISAMSTQTVIMSVAMHGVDDLLIEDWDAALGIRIETTDSRYVVVPASTRGRIILIEGQVAEVIESDDMPAYMDVLIGKAVNEAMVTHPGLKYLHDVWGEGRENWDE